VVRSRRCARLASRPGKSGERKFRQLGFIEYNGTLEVHSSLLSVVLHDGPRSVRGPEVSSFEQGRE